MSPLVVLVVLILGLLSLWGISWMAARTNRGEERFAAGGRTKPFVATLSMVTAVMTGVTFVSVPGSVAGSSLSYLQMCLGFVVGYAVIAYVLLPRFHALKILSLYEYLDCRFGRHSQMTGACMFLLSKLLVNALRLYLICSVLQFVLYGPLGVPLWVNVGIMSLVVWLSTRRGGVRSVLWMDVVKTLIIFACVTLCIIFAASMAGLDFEGAVDAVANHRFAQVWFVEDASDWRFLPKQFVAGIFMVVATTGLDQDFMQRALGGRNLHATQRSMMVAVVLQVVIIALLLVLGILLYIYMESCGVVVTEGFPLCDGAGEVVAAKSDDVMAFVAMRGGMPMVVGVLFVVGLLFSSFSAIGSAMTAQSTSVVVDILGGRNRGMEFMERWRKVALPVVAVATWGSVLLIDALCSDNVLNLTYDIAAYSYGPLLGLYTFGIFSRRQVCEKWLPCVVVVSPLLSYAIKLAAYRLWGFEFGFELLVLNAAITICGVWLTGIGKFKKSGYICNQ